MTGRLRKMLYVAAFKGYRNLILGAWGCGAFENNPNDVAGYFYKLFFEENLKDFFDNVVFAILGGDENYTAFGDVFGSTLFDSGNGYNSNNLNLGIAEDSAE